MVSIGNPGNAADTEVMSDGTTGYGSVKYRFNIGKYEITASQYTAFLNAVASTDSFGLFKQFVPPVWPQPPALDSGPKILRHDAAGSYSYTVSSNWANRPVNMVSLWDAMRFANWLHNGQPTTGVQNELNTEDGAYDLNGYTGDDGTLIVRKQGARFFLPNDNEWYKAAFHKNDGTTGNYWNYATCSDVAPSHYLINPDPGNNANYRDDHLGYTLGYPYYRSEVGEFENSESPYGTFDQAGNLGEWTETMTHDDFYPGTDFRSILGGADASLIGGLHAKSRSAGSPSSGGFSFGFRIASIPEPKGLLPITIASVILSGRRKRAVTR